MSENAVITARYKGFCTQCHYSIWRGERISWTTGRARHLDCLVALKDETNRQMEERWLRTIGRVRRRDVIRRLEARA